MSREQPKYHSYLLRLWQVWAAGRWVWRASLENAQTGSRLGFDSMEALCCHLQRRGDAPPDGDDRVADAE